MHKLCLSLSAVAVLGAVLPGQFLELPPAAAGVEGNSSTSYPWNRAASAIRIQYFYDSSAFISQGVVSPMSITGLWWRRQGNAAQASGSYAGVTVSVSTALTDYLTPDLTFDNNHGLDRAFVLTAGTVNLLPIAIPTRPNRYFVNIPLATPFIYDPYAGDLVVDIQLPAGGYSGTGSGTTDYSFGAGTPATRIFNLTDHNAALATGTNLEAGAVMGLDYTLVAGTASAQTYGIGCYDDYDSFMEYFQVPPGQFDLSNTALQLIPAGNGYVVTPTTSSFFTPTSPDLALGDDTLSPPLTLPFNFPLPDGTTTNQILVNSNGFVFLDPAATSAAAFYNNLAGFVDLEPRHCAFWGDLDPLTGSGAGTIHAEANAVNTIYYVTWLNVEEFGQAGSSNTFQIALFANGNVEYTWQDCSLVAVPALVGWSPGGGSRLPPSSDLSSGIPIVTATDNPPLGLTPLGRPVLATNVDFDVSSIPMGTTLGASILSFAQVNPGTELTGLGMPGCFQFLGLDTVDYFVPTGANYTLTVGIPPYVTLNGLHVYLQVATFSPGVNALGVLSSNAVDMTLNPL